jgi:hypothetical protein
MWSRSRSPAPGPHDSGVAIAICVKDSCPYSRHPLWDWPRSPERGVGGIEAYHEHSRANLRRNCVACTRCVAQLREHSCRIACAVARPCSGGATFRSRSGGWRAAQRRAALHARHHRRVRFSLLHVRHVNNGSCSAAKVSMKAFTGAQQRACESSLAAATFRVHCGLLFARARARRPAQNAARVLTISTASARIHLALRGHHRQAWHRRHIAAAGGKRNVLEVSTERDGTAVAARRTGQHPARDARPVAAQTARDNDGIDFLPG